MITISVHVHDCACTYVYNINPYRVYGFSVYIYSVCIYIYVVYIKVCMYINIICIYSEYI